MLNVRESPCDWQAEGASYWKQIQHLHVSLNHLQSVTGRISIVVFTLVLFKLCA